MEQNYTTALREFGLSENEIYVYVALLKIGESSVHAIAKNAELPRTTTYHLLESLLQKGIVSNIIKEKKKYFQATHPRTLPEIIEEKKRRVKESLPQLIALTETITEKPRVQLYEGIKGIRTILEDVLTTKKIILHYGDITSLQKSLQHIFPQFIKKRTEKRIPIKIICKKEEAHDELLTTAKKQYREFRFSSSNTTFPSSIFIYNDKVAILNLTRELYTGILIKNNDFMTTQKNMFESLWVSIQ